MITGIVSWVELRRICLQLFSAFILNAGSKKHLQVNLSRDLQYVISFADPSLILRMTLFRHLTLHTSWRSFSKCQPSIGKTPGMYCLTLCRSYPPHPGDFDSIIKGTPDTPDFSILMLPGPLIDQVATSLPSKTCCSPLCVMRSSRSSPSQT